MTRVVPVELADRTYDVVVGEGARHELARIVAQTVPTARRAVVVTQEGIGVEVDPGLPFEVVTVPDGESAKSLSQVEELCRRFARSGLSRADVVVAVGGGRGHRPGRVRRRLVPSGHGLRERGHVPARPGRRGHRRQDRRQHPRGEEPGRRLLAAAGGAVRHRDTRHPAAPGVGVGPRGGGQVRPPRDRDPVRRCPDVRPGRSTSRWPGASAIKAAVVVADEREGDRRMLLNYGHTLAHALEASAFGDDGSGLRHGEAVAIGLVFAALLARRLGRIDDARVDHHRRVVGGFDLATALPGFGRRRTAVVVHGPGQEGPGGPDLRPRRPDGRRGGPWRRPRRTWSLPWRTWSRAECAGQTRAVSAKGLVLLLSGPNLNLLGNASPRSTAPPPSTTTWPRPRRRPTERGLGLEHVQSNHEGDLVEAIQGARGRAVAIVINAGALSHTSWSLHDALAAFDGVVVELHLSNPAAREPFRHASTIAPVADGCIAGFGGLGYPLAVEAVDRILAARS